MHKRRMILWMLPAAAFTAVVFAGNPSLPPALPAAPTQSARTERGIVRMVSRGHAISVTSTAEGPRYSAMTTGGAMLANDLTLDDLRLREPALFREVNQATANAKDSLGSIGSVDAGD